MGREFQPERDIPFELLSHTHARCILYHAEDRGRLVLCKLRGLGAYARVPDVPIDAYYITSGPDSFAYVSDVRREIAKERRRKFGPLSIPSLERLRLYSEVALGKMNARISCIKPATVFFDAGRIDKSSGRMEFDVPKDFMESLFQGFDVGSAYGMIELVDAYREIMKIAA